MTEDQGYMYILLTFYQYRFPQPITAIRTPLVALGFRLPPLSLRAHSWLLATNCLGTLAPLSPAVTLSTL